MMHQRQRHGPSGEMELSWVHSESGNEHWDEYATIKLEANGDEIVLVESTRFKNSFRGGDDAKSDEYAISAKDLIDLIKAKGRKL
jgi:hypothetical protein